MRRRRLLGLALAAIGAGLGVAAALGGGFWSGSSRGQRADAFAVARPEAQEPAPDFELPDLAGRPVRLRHFRGRFVLLNFRATWCAPCREEMPALEALARELGERGLTVLAVDVREAASPVSDFARVYGLRFPILLDGQGAVVDRYRVIGLPATFFVDRTGTLVGVALGLRAWLAPEARSYLARLLEARG